MIENSWLCMVCYEEARIHDQMGTWCERCHKKFTEDPVISLRALRTEVLNED